MQSALASVAHHGPLTLGALAEREAVAPPSITKVVAKLEAEGLVQRTADATDRRFSHVQTTPAGDAFIAEDRRRRTAWLAAQVANLTDDERRRLADALGVLDRLTGLDQEAPKEP
jgi:DNA-binding MarR family transcriptional regulator